MKITMQRRKWRIRLVIATGIVALMIARFGVDDYSWISFVGWIFEILFLGIIAEGIWTSDDDD